MKKNKEEKMKNPYEVFSRAIGAAFEDFRQGYDQRPIGTSARDECNCEHDDSWEQMPEGSWFDSDGGRFHA